MVLTQYSAAAELPPPSPRAHGQALAHYRLLGSERERATVDYRDLSFSIEPYPEPAAPPPGVARYDCSLVRDSGPSLEVHTVLMIIAFRVPAARCAEVDRWYDEEHGPLLLRAPGWLRMRRYTAHHAVGGVHWTHLALHELRDAAVLDSAERAFARSTPWRARLEQESWFGQAGRWVYAKE